MPIAGARCVELLHDGHLTVQAVAARLGYHDAAGFARAFKRWAGSAPGGYRPGPDTDS
jgi:AraC-like DNA-binding protein